MDKVHLSVFSGTSTEMEAPREVFLREYLSDIQLGQLWRFYLCQELLAGSSVRLSIPSPPARLPLLI